MPVSDTLGVWQSYLNAFRNYFNISGYAARKEFWSFTLINILFYLLLIGLTLCYSPFVFIGTLYALVSMIPATSVTIRRFNDAGKGIWTLFLLQIISLVVSFVLSAAAAGAIQFLIGLYVLYILIRDTREHPKTIEKATVGAKIIFTLMYIIPWLLLIAVMIIGIVSGYFKAMTKYKAMKALNQTNHAEMFCPSPTFPFRLS